MSDKHQHRFDTVVAWAHYYSAENAKGTPDYTLFMSKCVPFNASQATRVMCSTCGEIKDL